MAHDGTSVEAKNNFWQDTQGFATEVEGADGLNLVECSFASEV